LRCIEDILKGTPHLLDTGRMNDEIFLNVVGLGLDAEVNHAVARKRDMIKRIGPTLTYTLAAVKVLLFFKPYDIEIELDGKDLGSHSISLCTIGNGTTCGGGYRLTPRAIMNDGQLDLSISGYIGRWRSISNIRTAFEGKHVFLPDNEYHNFKELRITCDKEMPYHIDGEAGYSERFDFKILERSLRTVHPHIGSCLE
jgi:diacylglycerol kinase family enzyme